MVSERKNILIITLSNIGDVILTTPVMASLRSLFPDAKFTVVVGPKAVGLLEGSREIERLLIYDKFAGWSHKLKLVRELREEFYDWVVDLRNSALPFLVRANRRSPVFRTHRAKSAREQHLEILRMMKFAVGSTQGFDFFSKKDEASLSEKLKKRGIDPSSDWVVVAPGAGSEAKRWKIEGFQAVLSRLFSEFPFKAMVVGDQTEKFLGEKLAHPQVVNLCGEINLRELGALVSRAKLVLTNDSACMHLGYELHRPVVAVFGPTDHEKYGRENQIWRIVREAPPSGLENLPSEKVFRACEELLNGIFTH